MDSSNIQVANIYIHTCQCPLAASEQVWCVHANNIAVTTGLGSRSSGTSKKLSCMPLVVSSVEAP